MDIREACISDLTNIAQLHSQSWRDNYQEALSAKYLNDSVYNERLTVWSQRLSKPKSNQLVLIAEVEGVFSGFVCAFGENHPEYGTIIDNLHVNPKVKGQGIGTKLLKAAATWAEENYQNQHLYLEVLACNPKAIGFYQALGGRNVASAFWQTPCGNKVKEFIYFWESPALLLNYSK